MVCPWEPWVGIRREARREGEREGVQGPRRNSRWSFM